MSVFGDSYAGAYDALYREKNYADECDMIQALLDEFGTVKPAHRMLDLGCGTGNHAIPLAGRGHAMAGVDLSAGMLGRAVAKAVEAGVAGGISFLQGDVRDVRLGGAPFDAAIMMFAVLGYQRSDADVRAALATARVHLRPGAAFIFDVWHGPGVLLDKPGPRERIIETPRGSIVRRTNSILDETNHLCSVQFELEVREGGHPCETTREEHTMRYFFREELEHFGAEAGLPLVALRRFPDWRRDITDASWNAVGVMRAV